MIGVWDFSNALANYIKADAEMLSLGYGSVFYKLAPTSPPAQFVISDMQDGSFERSLAGPINIQLVWQLACLSNDPENESQGKRANDGSQRLWELLDDKPDEFSPYLADLGYYCEMVQGRKPLAPRIQNIGNVQKWRFSTIYYFEIQPRG